MCSITVSFYLLCFWSQLLPEKWEPFSRWRMNRPMLFPGRPSILDIVSGLCRLSHIKQFISVFLSICMLLWILRFMWTKTFVILIFLCFGLIAILTIIERFAERNRFDAEDLPLLGGSGDQRQAPIFRMDYNVRVLGSSERNDENKICGICGDEMRNGCEIGELSCLHLFHIKCLEDWVRVEKSCPVCRTSYFS
jgi:hypothetical protein